MNILNYVLQVLQDEANVVRITFLNLLHETLKFPRLNPVRSLG